MEKSETVPVCGYQHNEDGEVVSQVFDRPAEKPDLPDGWYDSPAHIPDKAPAKKAATTRKAPAKKAADSDDAGE